MTPVIGVGAIIFDAAGRVLLIERGKPPAAGEWSVPGGKLEPGETLAQGAAREVREETGLVVEIGALACVVERITADYHFVILDYFARVIGGELRAGDDARAVQFVDRDALDAMPVTEGLREILARAHATQPAWSTSR